MCVRAVAPSNLRLEESRQRPDAPSGPAAEKGEEDGCQTHLLGGSKLAGLRSGVLGLVLLGGLVAAVGSLMLVYAQQPAEATFPGTPGRIAYWAFDGHDHEIYTIKPSGEGKVKVTDNSRGRTEYA